MNNYRKRFESGSRVINIVDPQFFMKEGKHDGLILTLDRAAGITVTLPPSTGRGARYTFIVRTTATGSYVIKVANSKDQFDGNAYGVDTDSEGASGYTWNADASDDTFTMSGTAQGGQAGDMLEIIDYREGYFLVQGQLTQSGGSEATPFSASV